MLFCSGTLPVQNAMLLGGFQVINNYKTKKRIKEGGTAS
jgi:hypothetical protein